MLLKRRHIRKRDFDYSSVNAYFITVCVYGHKSLLGNIENGIMKNSAIGDIAAQYLQQIPSKKKQIALDEFIVMPNHIHCIMRIKYKKNIGKQINTYSKPISNSISIIVNHFKGSVKKWCNNNGFSNFEWQGRFHDHVIRNADEYYAIKNYIINNPKNWKTDRFHS